jgi:hypothetical protein
VNPDLFERGAILVVLLLLALAAVVFGVWKARLK